MVHVCGVSNATNASRSLLERCSDDASNHLFVLLLFLFTHKCCKPLCCLSINRCLMFHRRYFLHNRPLCEKFWSPFNKSIVGYDLSKYNFNSTLKDIAPNGLSCSWNGRMGNGQVVEDFFTVVLAGFDVTGVSLAPGGDGRVFSGVVQMQHTRPFISWKPTHINMALPFTMKLEAIDNAISHIHFRCDLRDELVRVGCPPEIAACVDNQEAMSMLVALRRVRVKPDIITYNALLSASKKHATWSSALGIL